MNGEISHQFRTARPNMVWLVTSLQGVTRFPPSYSMAPLMHSCREYFVSSHTRVQDRSMVLMVNEDLVINKTRATQPLR
jgi:hypothetical protein